MGLGFDRAVVQGVMRVLLGSRRIVLKVRSMLKVPWKACLVETSVW